MTTIGMVAEWNPFHKGHQRLLDVVRDEVPGACVVSVMSGAFCQRGEVACFDKWLRAEMALAAGVDVVLELPQVYASASLETFARGGVATLLAFAPLDALYAGSESGDEAALAVQAAYLRTHSADFDRMMRTAAEQGLNYAQASQQFLREAGFAAAEKNAPNDRLALQYRLALPPEVPMHLVQRTVAHDAMAAKAQTMSASAIRAHLPNDFAAVSDYLPKTSVAIIQRALADGWQPADTMPLVTALKVMACHLSPEDVARQLNIRDGWSPRLLAAIGEASTFEAIIDRAQTRHYSRSRIRRLLLALVSPLPPAPRTPGYLRVLGFSDRGRAFLRTRKGGAPLVVNVGKDRWPLAPAARALLEGDISRQNLADLLTTGGSGGRDFREPPRVQR